MTSGKYLKGAFRATVRPGGRIMVDALSHFGSVRSILSVQKREEEKGKGGLVKGVKHGSNLKAVAGGYRNTF